MYMQKANKNNVATTSMIKSQQKMQYFSTVDKEARTVVCVIPHIIAKDEPEEDDQIGRASCRARV